MGTRMSWVVFLLLCSGVLVFSQRLPYGKIEADCTCTSNGFSGKVNTKLIGCDEHTGSGGPFCYVVDPRTCNSATKSQKFPGAAWVSCSKCVCAEDGVSNGVSTGRRGCALHVSNEGPFCYIKQSKPCRGDSASGKFSGARYKSCSNSEALYFAAKINDVAMIGKLRSRGANMAVSVGVTYPSGAVFSMTVAEYAAAYGSYDVVEDLIITANSAYSCVPAQKPSRYLCDFSSASKCIKNSVQRNNIEQTLSSYENACH